MKKTMALVCAACAVLELVAAPAAKVEPVAAGFPQWQGLSPKSHIMGREITASDLRHRITVVIEVEPNAGLHDQLLTASSLVQLTDMLNIGLGAEGVNFEILEMPRNVLIFVTNRGAKNPEAIKVALKPAGQEDAMLAYFRNALVPFYDDVSFVDGPDTAGKRPYIYVMGPTGTEPIAQCKLDAAGVKEVHAAVVKAKKQLAEGPKWREFFGSADPEKFPALAKAIQKGKPLGQISAAILKDVLSKDPEKAAEAQIVYDAISQTRSDIMFRIRLEAPTCPHRAYYDIQRLVTFWPSEKKKLDEVLLKMKAVPDAEKLAKIFTKVMVWADPDFVCKNASEAKKIVAELEKKVKPQLAKMKESNVIVIQNGALIVDSQVDELIATIPSRLPEK